MKRIVLVVVCLLIGLSILLAQRGCAAKSQPATAEAMLKEIVDLQPPALDESKQADDAYIQSYVAKRKEFVNTMLEMAARFYEAYPDHPQALPLMMERWAFLSQQRKSDQVLRETEKSLARNPSAEVKADLLFIRAYSMVVGLPETTSAKAGTVVEDFVKGAPSDQRGAELLYHLAESEADAQKQLVTYKRIVEAYKDTQEAAMANGIIRQNEGLGKPFELSFTDAISGKTINVQKDLQGKIVVVDFWATWCAPCVADMPNLKAAYKKYKDQGVEILGVNLDAAESEGGLKQMTEFVKANDLQWPQYYQGNKWKSEFSASWGIATLPSTFIVDHEGKLYSNLAFGKLETLIPELIARRDAAKKP